jgi:hypothetical protein
MAVVGSRLTRTRESDSELHMLTLLIPGILIILPTQCRRFRIVLLLVLMALPFVVLFAATICIVSFSIACVIEDHCALVTF